MFVFIYDCIKEGHDVKFSIRNDDKESNVLEAVRI